MRTVYLGTSEFAATVLRRLAGSPHRPALVVTPPDRRQGRGRKVSPPPAALAAKELGLDLLQAENVNDEVALERIRAAEPEAVLVCAFGQLIREPLLSEFPMLNVHPSLLPRWRGAAPIERAIMARDETTGVCVMKLTEGLDSGPVALREELSLGPDEDFASLSSRLAEVGGELLVRALDLLATGALELAEQSEEGVTYAEKIEPGERRLDPSRPAAELAAKVRALNPHVGTYLELGEDERLGVRRAKAVEAEVEPGRLVAQDGALLLGCGEGALRLEAVQPPGGKPMPADAYLRGHPLPER
ncbi:MAG TPA: methionyl-tRNA formyltransferase [Solirubrobacterales bacterium]|nr:methionyl-tRNA formyltransferase [Solirubrobacterales bacterium]